MRTKSKNNKPILFILLIVIVGICLYIFLNNKNTKIIDKDVKLNTSATSTKNINFDPLNFTYEVEGETIKLVGGTSTVDISPGSAEKLETVTFNKPAIGDLNHDGKNDSAVLLVQDSGGSGLFYYLVAIIDEAGVAKNTNSIFIGDRIEPKNISISNNKIRLDFVDRNIDEPMSAEPTVKKTKFFEVNKGDLMPVK